jgi:hypothetical protein
MVQTTIFIALLLILYTIVTISEINKFKTQDNIKLLKTRTAVVTAGYDDPTFEYQDYIDLIRIRRSIQQETKTMNNTIRQINTTINVFVLNCKRRLVTIRVAIIDIARRILISILGQGRNGYES